MYKRRDTKRISPLGKKDIEEYGGVERKLLYFVISSFFCCLICKIIYLCHFNKIKKVKNREKAKISTKTGKDKTKIMAYTNTHFLYFT
jgi:hypothetical protein